MLSELSLRGGFSSPSFLNHSSLALLAHVEGAQLELF